MTPLRLSPLLPPCAAALAGGLAFAAVYGLAYQPDFTAGLMLGLLLAWGCPAWLALWWAVTNWEESEL